MVAAAAAAAAAVCSPAAAAQQHQQRRAPCAQQQQPRLRASCSQPAPCAATRPFTGRPPCGQGALEVPGSSRLGRLQARRQRDPVLAPVIPMGPEGEEMVDLYGYLLRNRIIFLNQRVNDQVATQIVASLLALNSLNDREEIKLYINCAAGSPYAVISILDTMNAIAAPVSTVGFGMVGGAAAVILAAGAKGKRFSMPSTRILLQQPMGGLQGSADECNITATELNRQMRVMYKFLSNFSGLPEEQIEQECDRDNFLSPKQAIELGMLDGVIGSP